VWTLYEPFLKAKSIEGVPLINFNNSIDFDFKNFNPYYSPSIGTEILINLTEKAKQYKEYQINRD